MGNDSSTPDKIITFHNCSDTQYSIVSTSNGSNNLPKSSSSCESVTFPYETNDFTLTGSDGQIYKLLGTSIAVMGYSDVFIWNNSKAGTSVYDDKFYYVDGNYVSGTNLSPGLHVAFNNQSVVVLVNMDTKDTLVNPVDFNSAFVYVNAPDKSTKPDKKDDDSTPIKIPPIFYIMIIMITLLIATIVVGYVVYRYYSKKKSIHTSSNS